MKTRTGNYPIGFRRGRSEWQKDLKALATWARANEFEALDLGRPTAEDVALLQRHNLRLGTSDLVNSSRIASSDEAERSRVREENLAHIRQATAAGARVFFTCVFPGNATQPRAESYKQVVEAYAPLAEECAGADASLAVEGYPGGYPHYAAFCCTPETMRAFIKDIGARGVGLNYDPSHLIRLGVDHIRFLREFAPYVRHVHAKDTEIMDDAIYEFGLYQPAVFAKGHGFGGHTWRYTLPGHGQARWTEIFRILQDANYQGIVSIELEDQNFNGSEQGEQDGLLRSRDFLRGA